MDRTISVRVKASLVLERLDNLNHAVAMQNAVTLVCFMLEGS